MFNLLKLLNQLRKYSHLAVTDPAVYFYFKEKADQSPKWMKDLIEEVIEDRFKEFFSV